MVMPAKVIVSPPGLSGADDHPEGCRRFCRRNQQIVSTFPSTSFFYQQAADINSFMDSSFSLTEK
jgi:hypothetical protein